MYLHLREQLSKGSPGGSEAGKALEARWGHFGMAEGDHRAGLGISIVPIVPIAPPSINSSF